MPPASPATNPFAQLSANAVPSQPAKPTEKADEKASMPSASPATNPFAHLSAKAVPSQQEKAVATPATGATNPFAHLSAAVPSQPEKAVEKAVEKADETSTEPAGEDDTSAGSVFKGLANETAAEEDEDLVYTCRARAFKLETGWTSQGTGVVKLLKHKTTGRSRIVLRIEPSGNIGLNTFLKKEFDYQKSGNSVQFMVPVADGAPEHWAIRTKAEFVQEFHEKIEEIKN
ncbi:hypothetical protein N7470_005474 [Penicillium chermesinum]|nr:hypothetical protein N7470_005474 [Penicillium chermesinum]